MNRKNKTRSMLVPPEMGKTGRLQKSKGGKIVSLVEKLFDIKVPAKTAAKKKQVVDESRAEELLQEEMQKNPQLLDELSDEDYMDLMDSLSPATRAKFGVGDEPADDMLEMMQDMSPAEAAQNLQFFNSVDDIQNYTMGLNPQQTREFLDNVPEDDYDLFGGFENMVKELGPREVKAKGGQMNSLFIPPEMEMEDKVPEDTYSNIPEDEMEDVLASQKPDDEMEKDYVSYVMGETLSEEEIDYVNSMLESDDKLSQIFDKLILSAAEFDGAGEVEGPGDGTSDDIPARLSDGEFVFTKKATDQLGAENLQSMMDEAERAYDGGLMKKAQGGLMFNPMSAVDDPVASGGTSNTTTPSAQTQLDVERQMLRANRMPSLIGG